MATVYRLTPEELRAIADELDRRGASYGVFIEQDYTADPITTIETDGEHGEERFRVNFQGDVLA